MERLFRSNAIQEVLTLSSLNRSAGGIDRGCIEQSEVQCGKGELYDFGDHYYSIRGLLHSPRVCSGLKQRNYLPKVPPYHPSRPELANPLLPLVLV
jgi:hypothetical protein